MIQPDAKPVQKRAVDGIQQALTDYACNFRYENLPADTVHAAKVRVIDTLGALMGGFSAEPCRIARTVAAAMPNADGATVIGTRLKTTAEMAAYVNAATARYVEMNDTYHWPGAFGGHPSDVLTPVLAAAEHVHASGRDLLAAVVLAYEVYQSFSDVFKNTGRGFDHTNLCTLGSALGAGRLFGLTPVQMAHGVALAAVPNVILRQVRMDHYSMYKAVASGHAGRAGVFAAILARAGMEGPHLPFEGAGGWRDHVAREPFALALGGNGAPYKIARTVIKPRACCGSTISSALAAEQVAPLAAVDDVAKIVVETYGRAKDDFGTGEHRWHPDTRETADHSIPYVVAVTLMDGAVTPRSFDDERLWNPQLRALIQKIEVVENADYTAAYARLPVEHRTRVTLTLADGKTLIGEAGGDKHELSAPKSDQEIDDKFRLLCVDALGRSRVDALLEQMWRLDTAEDMAVLPPAFAIA